MRKLVLIALFFPSLALAATGSIDVQVQNAPGEIVLDGFPTDKRAPALLEQVPIGTHVVELEYGCMVGKAEVNVAEGAKAVVKLPLQNRGGEGTLRLKGVPFNAEIMVDGAPVSKAEEGVKLPCGARRIEVNAAGFSSFSEVVVITTGKWTTLEPKLVEDMEEPVAPKPAPAAKPKPDPDLAALDEEAEEEEARPPARQPVRADFDEEEEEDLDSERDPDAMDEDELLEQESDEELDTRGGRGGEDEEEEEIRRPSDEEEEIRRPSDEEEEEIRRPSDDEEDEPYRPPKEKKPVPKRALLTAGLGVAGVTGVAIGAANTPAYLDNKAAYDAVVAVNGPTSPQAIELSQVVTQAKTNMMSGYVLGGIGVAGATAAFLLVPGISEKEGEDEDDLAFALTPGGVVISGRF